MNGLKIEYVDIRTIKPNEDNAKIHTEEQIEQIKKSIKEFGMCDPIGVWKNIIVEGHGRYEACEELNITKIPVIRLDNLTDEQRRAYTLVHNKLTMNTDFDIATLNDELERILDIDMQDFGFDLGLDLEEDTEEPEGSPDDEEGYFGDERERTYNSYNLHEYNAEETEGFYNIPIIAAVDHVPTDLIPCNYMLTSKEYNKGIHFFKDDYQFERFWNRPYDYLEYLRMFDCVLSPDFSLYQDMPEAMKIWNCYRSHLLGQFWQKAGVNVIPTLLWADEKSYNYCFDGYEKGGTYAVACIGIKEDEENVKNFTAGMDEAIKRLEPKRIIYYGTQIGYDFDSKGVEVVYIAAKQFV